MGVAVGNMIEPFVNKEFHDNGRWDCWKELHGLPSICQKIQRKLPSFTGSSTGTFANDCFAMHA